LTDPQVKIRRGPAPELISHLEVDLSRVTSLSGVADLQAEVGKGIVVDSDMPFHKIFDKLALSCPDEVLVNQMPLRVFYYGFDGKLHQGQIVVDERLEKDVLEIFRIAREHEFPLESVIPLSAPGFQKDGAWSDDASMDANNTSAFCYRTIAGQNRLSMHALGMAVDLNPTRNPFFRQVKDDSGGQPRYTLVSPPNGQYDTSKPGTFTGDNILVRAFKSMGWTWGGDWKDPLDLHHFQKIPAGAEEYVKRYRP